jgi:hypothetical protein
MLVRTQHATGWWRTGVEVWRVEVILARDAN